MTVSHLICTQVLTYLRASIPPHHKVSTQAAGTHKEKGEGRGDTCSLLVHKGRHNTHRHCGLPEVTWAFSYLQETQGRVKYIMEESLHLTHYAGYVCMEPAQAQTGGIQRQNKPQWPTAGFAQAQTTLLFPLPRESFQNMPFSQQFPNMWAPSVQHIQHSAPLHPHRTTQLPTPHIPHPLCWTPFLQR